MEFLRGLWRQKLAVWGPSETVRATLFSNFEKNGIDPAILKCAMPFWSTGKQLDYAVDSFYALTGNPVFKRNSISFDGSGDYILANSVADSLSDGRDTGTMMLKSVIRDISKAAQYLMTMRAGGISRYYVYNDSGNYSIRFDAEAAIDTGEDFTIGSSELLTLAWNNPDVSAYFGPKLVYNISHRSQYKPDTFGISCVSNVPASTAYQAVQDVECVFVFDRGLSQDEVSLIDENIWQFWQPPVFRSYFIPSGVSPSIINLNDSGTISEAISIQVGASVIDAGAGVDNFDGLGALVPVLDSGSGGDDITTIASLSVSDTSAAIDIVSGVLSAITVSESCTAVDSISNIIAAVVLADSGVGSEAVDVSILGEIIKTIFDVGGGVDTVNAPRVSFSLFDSATGSDLIKDISSALSLQDSAHATDIVDIIKAYLVRINDSGAGNDAVTMGVSLVVDDVASAADTIGRVLSSLSISDNGIGTDTAIATDLNLLPHGKVKITFSIRVPSVSFTIN